MLQLLINVVGKGVKAGGARVIVGLRVGGRLGRVGLVKEGLDVLEIVDLLSVDLQGGMVGFICGWHMS